MICASSLRVRPSSKKRFANSNKSTTSARKTRDLQNKKTKQTSFSCCCNWTGETRNKTTWKLCVIVWHAQFARVKKQNNQLQRWEITIKINFTHTRKRTCKHANTQKYLATFWCRRRHEQPTFYKNNEWHTTKISSQETNDQHKKSLAQILYSNAFLKNLSCFDECARLCAQKKKHILQIEKLIFVICYERTSIALK